MIAKCHEPFYFNPFIGIEQKLRLSVKIECNLTLSIVQEYYNRI